MEGEENKLTTFSTWTIILGCNESNIIFQQHLCKLGQSNGRNSKVLGQAMKKRPTGHYKKYSHFKGRDTAPTTSSREGSCIVDLSTSGTLHCSVAKIPDRGARRTRTILSHDCTEDGKTFCTALPIHLRVQSMVKPFGDGLLAQRTFWFLLATSDRRDDTLPTTHTHTH